MASSSPRSESGAASPTSVVSVGNASSAVASTTNGQSLVKGDLSLKYHKLATEYAKLRAQFGIVKKAVVDEQAKNAQLTEKVRVKEVESRKREAEMESLHFRNQQLTRRIQVLQDEMESLESSSATKKGKNKSRHHNSDLSSIDTSIQSSEALNSVIGQELQSKIEENAKLHAKLADIDTHYESVIETLQEKIKDLEMDSKNRAQIERAEENKQKDLLDGLRAEKSSLLEQIERLEKELIDHQDRITMLTVQLESASGSPSHGGLASSSANQLYSSGSKNVDDFANFPLTRDEVRIQSIEMLSQFSENISELVASFSDFHTYWEHRLKDTHPDGPMSDGASSLSRLLLQNVKYLKPIESSLQSVISKVLSSSSDFPAKVTILFSDFAQAFKGYLEFSCSVESLTTSCLQYESNMYSCPASQQAKNKEFQVALHGFNRILVRLSDYLENLPSGEEKKTIEAIENINVAIAQLKDKASELCSVYALKSEEENLLPTVTEQLKNTNQCINAALSSMVSCIDRLARLMFNGLPKILMLVQAESRAFQEKVDGSSGVSQQMTASYQDTRSQSLGNVNEEFIKLQKEVEELREKCEDWQAQVNETYEKLKKSEQNREHFKLESHLLEMKYEKLRSSLSEDSASLVSDQGVSSAEAELKAFYSSTLNELVSDRLLADSQATALQVECNFLQKRLCLSERKCKALKEELDQLRQELGKMHDEMGATSANYENQLGLITEHVANLNNKLTSQTDEIETLKYELSKKGKK